MIYKFHAPTSYSLDNLENRRLFCRHYNDFNDPFEFWSRVASGVPSPDEPERLQAALAMWGFPDPDNAEPHEEYFDSLAVTQPDFPLLFDHTRIACFAREATSLLMWSHYADGMRGFCIGFEEEGLPRNPTDYFTDVEYLDQPPLVDSFVYAVAEDQYDYHVMVIDERPRTEAYFGPDPISDEDYQRCADEALDSMKTIWRRAFAVKPRQWEYEGERRLLIRTEKGEKEPVFHPYPTEAVREVILGERMEPRFRQRLAQVVAKQHPSAILRECSRLRDTYGLTVETSQLPDPTGYCHGSEEAGN